MKKIENTVPAENQMKNSNVLSFLGNENAKIKILTIGNSITRHGPKAEIGWTFDWGMAASAPEKDYVHRLFSMIKENGSDVYMRIRQSAYWEGNYTSETCLSEFNGESDYKADIVIYRLGENVPSDKVPEFKVALEKLMGFLCGEKTKVVFTTCFWGRSELDDIIKQVAKERGYLLADINCTDEKQMALGQFEHKGVAAHPSDIGMEMIANKIFEQLRTLLD